MCLKKKTSICMIATLIIGVVIGGIVLPSVKKDPITIPPLKIIGDVENSLSLMNLDEFEISKINRNDDKLEAVYLEHIIKKSKPCIESYKTLIVGNDGLIAEIEGNNLEECYITYSIKNGWEAVNFKHPKSSNVKRIKEIVVVSNENSWDYGFNVFNKDENIINITPGQLYMKAVKLYPNFEGKSSVEKEGKTYKTSIYTQRKIFRLNDIANIPQDEEALIMGKKGECSYLDDNSYFELKDNYIDYIFPDGKRKIERVQGVLINPTKGSVRDTYYEVFNTLKDNEKVMVLFLDGFGYHQYEYAINNGYAPYLNKLPKGEKVTTVFKPVTNAGFTAMITGKTPEENGIYSRKQRQPKVPTIFDAANKLNKKSLLVEGDIQIISTEVEPILNLDSNGNETMDDEIFKSAEENLEGDYDFAFIHFHGIDDSGHSNGDLSQETMEAIKRTDNYVKSLCEKWTGRVIITADHGMHSKEVGGYHGVFRCEDMIVPYITFLK